jgi:hypothetical protein
MKVKRQGEQGRGRYKRAGPYARFKRLCAAGERGVNGRNGAATCGGHFGGSACGAADCAAAVARGCRDTR